MGNIKAQVENIIFKIEYLIKHNYTLFTQGRLGGINS